MMTEIVRTDHEAKERTEDPNCDERWPMWSPNVWLCGNLPSEGSSRMMKFRQLAKRARMFPIGVGLFLCLVLGCSIQQPSRIDAYLSPSPLRATGMTPMPRPSKVGGLNAGLLVINDTTAESSAPPLSSQGLHVFTDQTRMQVSQAVPINLTKMLPSTAIKANGQTEQFIRASREAGVEYLVLVVISSTEMESPATFAIEVGSESFAGTSTQNYSLVEIGLLDGRTGAVLVRAEARERATLKRLNNEFVTSHYPMITRDGGVRLPWWQIRDQHDALRVASGVEALTEAVQRFEKAWENVFPER